MYRKQRWDSFLLIVEQWQAITHKNETAKGLEAFYWSLTGKTMESLAEELFLEDKIIKIAKWKNNLFMNRNTAGHGNGM